MSWSNDSVLEFIELYKSEEILWNPKHPSYKNRCQVSKAWERIRNNFGVRCSVTDLKKKKESLLTSYRSIKKKNLPEFRVSWFAFPLLDSFLGGKYKNEGGWVEGESVEFIDASSFTSNEPCSDDLNFESTKLNEGTKTKNIMVNQCKQNDPRLSNCKRKNPSYQRIEEQLIKISPDESDESDLYCQLLAKKLKKLDENQREIAMHEINNIVFRLKMEQNNYESQTISSKMKSPVFVITAEASDSNNGD
ncbi:unnamed protein product [Leptosia nina]|uniref:MADF domain-containing protein n=1 Tax=Leptosia nina TaxID=320188 RepID=A0AAV1J5N0_9NEOP